jgi:hypothetical protein
VFNKKICTKLLIVYVYFQPNSCNTHTDREWAQGTFLRQPRKVPPAHVQRVYQKDWKFVFQCALKEYCNYSLFSTCIESSQYLLRNDRYCKAVEGLNIFEKLL